MRRGYIAEGDLHVGGNRNETGPATAMISVASFEMTNNSIRDSIKLSEVEQTILHKWLRCVCMLVSSS